MLRWVEHGNSIITVEPGLRGQKSKWVWLIRKYHNHILMSNQRHREEEPQNIYSQKTSKRQYKQSNQLSLPRQYWFALKNTLKFQL